MESRVVAAVVGVLLACGCTGDGEDPGYSVTPGMFESVPFDPYDPNPTTYNGATLQAPPVVTVPFGPVHPQFGATKEEAKRAGEELVNPFAEPTPAVLKRGKYIYNTFCYVCHGVRGDGDGPVIGPERFPNPASLQADRAKTLPDGTLYHVITYGQGIMPAYNVQVQHDDRWKAITYIRQLQAPQGGAK